MADNSGSLQMKALAEHTAAAPVPEESFVEVVMANWTMRPREVIEMIAGRIQDIDGRVQRLQAQPLTFWTNPAPHASAPAVPNGLYGGNDQERWAHERRRLDD